MRSPERRALAALLAVVLLGCVFHADGVFFRWAVHRDLLRAVSVDGLLAVGMTAVIVTGGIDLSVGSVVALSAVAFASLTLVHGVSAVVAIPVVLALGVVVGLVNGLLVGRGLPPFVVTLSTMVAVRGLAKVLSGGRKVTSVSPEHPPIFGLLDGRVLGGEVAVVTLVLLATALVVHVSLARTAFGRHVYAVGGNDVAAGLAGVPVGRTRALAYAICGLCAAIGGVCQAAQETHGDPDTAMGHELDAIAMVVIGGTSLRGGVGGVPLTLVGMLVVGLVDKVLSLNAVPEAWRLVATGGIVLAAVGVQNVVARHPTRVLSSRG